MLFWPRILLSLESLLQNLKNIYRFINKKHLLVLRPTGFFFCFAEKANVFFSSAKHYICILLLLRTSPLLSCKLLGHFKWDHFQMQVADHMVTDRRKDSYPWKIRLEPFFNGF